MSTPYDAHGRDHGGHDPRGPGAVHETVGAYALGILDDAEATEFEAHLAGCEICARQLEEFAGMEPMLAALADLPGAQEAQGARGAQGMPGSPGAPEAPDAAVPRPRGLPAVGEQLAARPGPRLAERLVDEVAERRARRRRRGLFLAAAAAALIVGGPLAVVAVDGDDGSKGQVAIDPHPTSPAEDAFFHHMEEKKSATDPKTEVTATVGTERKAWGTHTVLELKNVKGPLKCSLVAVGKDGKRETVSSWSVPKWGYGIKDSSNKWARNPLYVHGGAAFDRDDIDRFEVTTFGGERLVSVDV
ncbi:anti-sigma factor family protein [Streptomyces sp. AN091965]|uniref:anti-sigma factor family protein n=1 Tax=Streptomyces sp. AN091965 TaxID=2927803 RepID=UPI001F60568B|nr:zf-HC2 domain-containing protein [Streptomyces sp. AN091965]MCI3931018.1 zf-HC2 domain-containing protein [Streptomyces sp. AN091965]